jgi:Holliday junction resolvase RusA-like endonuclease
MQELFLVLPLPPSINSYWGYHGSRRFIAQEGKDFKAVVMQQVLSQPVRFGQERLCMAVELFFRDRRRADISNRIKALEDALVAAGLMDDDSQIDLQVIKRGPVFKGGKCEVRIAVISATGSEELLPGAEFLNQIA